MLESFLMLARQCIIHEGDHSLIPDDHAHPSSSSERVKKLAAALIALALILTFILWKLV